MNTCLFSNNNNEPICGKVTHRKRCVEHSKKPMDDRQHIQEEIKTEFTKIIEKDRENRREIMKFLSKLKFSKKNTSCAICMGKTPKEKLVDTECKHSFHSECIRKWLHKKNQCPLCRRLLLRI